MASGSQDELKHTEDGKAYVAPGTKTLATQWLTFGVTRKTTKRSVMTLAYGSKEYGFKEQLMEDILWPAKRAATRPDGTVDPEKFPFESDGFRAAGYMAHLIWIAVNKVLVKAGEAMAWLQEAAGLAAKEGLPVRWTTPVGFPVMQAYPALERRRVKTAINGSVLYLVMNQETEGLDTRKQGQGISPNFIHSCDAAHLMLTVARAKEDGIGSFAMIHDSFGTTAGDTERMFHVVREAFIEMYTEVDVLAAFRDELAAQLSEKQRKKLAELPESGTLDLSAVADSRFCFA
jgi:DNA-directed RNA polymerase